MEDTHKDVIELHEAATKLLNHLEDVLDEKNFDAISAKLWNDVSMFLVMRGIKVETPNIKEA